jgi:hypothetical protein
LVTVAVLVPLVAGSIMHKTRHSTIDVVYVYMGRDTDLADPGVAKDLQARLSLFDPDHDVLIEIVGGVPPCAASDRSGDAAPACESLARFHPVVTDVGQAIADPGQIIVESVDTNTPARDDGETTFGFWPALIAFFLVSLPMLALAVRVAETSRSSRQGVRGKEKEGPPAEERAGPAYERSAQPTALIRSRPSTTAKGAPPQKSAPPPRSASAVAHRSASVVELLGRDLPSRGHAVTHFGVNGGYIEIGRATVWANAQSHGAQVRPGDSLLVVRAGSHDGGLLVEFPNHQPTRDSGIEGRDE